MSVNRYNSTTGELEKIAGGAFYAEAPVGSIIPYGGATAPSGWLLCQGQAVSRTEYADLFNVIGTNYGSGGRSSTFNLPTLTQCKQDYTVKTPLDTWGSSLEEGSRSHTFTIDKDGSYYFEVVLSNDTEGKKSNNISITRNNDLVCSWGFVGSNAILQNKTIFLKAGTYTITHVCQTVGIKGVAEVTVYSTRNAPVGSYIIKAKHTPVPTDFMDAVNGVVETAIADELHYNARVNSSVRMFITSSQTHTFTATKTGLLKAYMHKSGSGYTARLFVNEVPVDQLSCFEEDSSGTVLPWIVGGGIDTTLSAFVKEGDVVKIDSDENNSPSTDSWYLYATVLQYKS